jgi:hypothetical protein
LRRALCRYLTLNETEMTMSILGRASVETKDFVPNGPNMDSGLGINGKVFRTVFPNPL